MAIIEIMCNIRSDIQGAIGCIEQRLIFLSNECSARKPQTHISQFEKGFMQLTFVQHLQSIKVIVVYKYSEHILKIPKNLQHE